MKDRHTLRQLLTRYGTIMAFLVLVIVFSVTIPGFVRSENLLNILRQIALLLIISEGFTMCLIVGELDLSFGSVASLASVLVAGLIIRGHNPAGAVLLSLLVGLAFGIGNGLLVTKIGISSLITTLASGIIASGMVYMYTKGVSFYGNMPEAFLALGRGSIGRIPVLVVIMFAVLIATHVLIKRTTAGRYMEATGGNRVAAMLAGVNTDFYRVLGLTLSGLAAAMTGILLTSRLGAANPEGASGFQMDAFATALLGQTVINVGRPSPLGTFIGTLLIGVLNNGLTLLGAQYYIQDITKGSIIILSVVVTSLQAKRLEGK